MIVDKVESGQWWYKVGLSCQSVFIDTNLPETQKLYIADRLPSVKWAGWPIEATIDYMQASTLARAIGRQIRLPDCMNVQPPQKLVPYHQWFCCVQASINKVKFISHSLPIDNKTDSFQSEIDQVNRNGFPICLDKVAGSCEEVRMQKAECEDEICNASHGVLTQQEMLRRGRHLRLEEFVDRDLPQMICEYRKINDKKWHKLINAADSDGIIRNGFNFHGCVTGRATSSLLHGLSMDDIRAILSQGQYTWIDFRHIEPQIMAWVANDMGNYLWICRDDDFYLNFGSKLKVSKDIAKSVVLGCQYGLGAKTMSRTLNVSEDIATNLVAKYRYHNPRVVAFWQEFFNDALQALSSSEARYFRVVNNDLVMRTPAGRDVYYANARIYSNPYEKKIAYQHPNGSQREIYPSMLVQNYCQAIGYDLLGLFLRNLLAEGHHVIYHRHDEVGICGWVDFGDHWELKMGDREFIVKLKIEKFEVTA